MRLPRPAALALPLLMVACSTQTSLDISTRTPDACEQVWSDFLADAPASVHLTQIPNPTAFLKRFNAYPPPSNTHADEIWTTSGAAGMVILFVTGDCLTQAATVDKKSFTAMMGSQI